MAVNKIEKIIGMTAGLAGIFGLYIAIYGVPSFLKPAKKIAVNKTDLMNNPALVYGSFRMKDTLKLSETFIVKWSGVSDCGDRPRVDSEYNAAFENWKNTTVQQIDSLVLVNSGHTGSVPNARTNTNRLTGVRKCAGSGTIECWIEFVK